MKPIIGVMPLWDEEKNSIWMLPGYLDGILKEGGLPFIFPFTKEAEDIKRLVDMCGGILFTGGQDVSPALYKERAGEGMGQVCPMRDEMEMLVFKEGTQKGKAILGICRGLQFINVALGGSLYQDLPTEHPSSLIHSQKPPYDMPSHRVGLTEDSPLYELLKATGLEVNSCHHQGIKKVAEPLEVAAISPDGLPEAVFWPEYPFLWAVQWHPEFSYETEEASRKIFRRFVEAAGAGAMDLKNNWGRELS